MSEGVSGSVERNKRLAELAYKAFLKREECSAPSAGADQSGAASAGAEAADHDVQLSRTPTLYSSPRSSSRSSSSSGREPTSDWTPALAETF